MTVAIDELPLGENTRVEITIQPWAISALDGTRPSSSIHGIWFTKFNPLYSHPFALETEAGTIVCKVPKSLLKLAIFETSKWMDAISNSCKSDCDPYFKQVKWRYATLRSILTIISETHGVSSVTRKVLGDFEIEFDNSSNDNNLISRILRELAELEPIIISGGCLGIGTSYGPQGMVKGSSDPYRPLFGRTWWSPLEGEAGPVRGKFSPNYNRTTRYPNRFRNATQRLINKPRRGGN